MMDTKKLEGMENVHVIGNVAVQQFEFQSVDGVMVKRIRLLKGMIAKEHTHEHSHMTIVGRGKVRLWKDNKNCGDHDEGEVLDIEAGVEHYFYAHVDTDIYCIHNESRALGLLKLEQDIADARR